MDTKKYAQDYANFYQNLTSATTKEQYKAFFDTDSYFEDPFQKVYGDEAIYKIFEAMYESLHAPKFKILEVVCSDEIAYIRWEFHYALSKKDTMNSFTGVSRITFNEQAKISSHIDYWDAGQHVYEKIPLLGSILRFIKKKVHA